MESCGGFILITILFYWFRPTSGKRPLKRSQVNKVLLRHLNEKYGEKFVVLSADLEKRTLGGPGRWNFKVCPLGGSEQLSSFDATWDSPRSDSLSEIWDNYWLVKMRPLFREAIDQGLASVIPEFLADYSVSTGLFEMKILSGGISDEELLQWAQDHVTLNVNVVMPAVEGFTVEDLTAQVAPLVDSGNTFGAASVSVWFDVYHQDDYSRWVSSREDLVQRRTDRDIIYECCQHNGNQGDPQFDQKITWSRK